MEKYQWLRVVSLSFLMVGCNNAVDSTDNNGVQVPTNYSKPVINNQGKTVQTQLDDYAIKVLSTSTKEANAQDRHKGVVVRINGKNSETMAIETSYIDSNIIVTVEKNTKVVAVSEEIKVSDDVPVIVVEFTL